MKINKAFLELEGHPIAQPLHAFYNRRCLPAIGRRFLKANPIRAGVNIKVIFPGKAYNGDVQSSRLKSHICWYTKHKDRNLHFGDLEQDF